MVSANVDLFIKLIIDYIEVIISIIENILGFFNVAI